MADVAKKNRHGGSDGFFGEGGSTLILLAIIVILACTCLNGFDCF